MRTPYRIACTVLAAGSLLPLGISPAYAETQPVPVEAAAWFWKAQVSGDLAPGVPYPDDLPTDASGVPKDRLAVAYKGDTEANPDGTKKSIPDKATYLRWDVYSIPEGSTLNSFVFTLFVDQEAKSNAYLPQKVEAPGQPAVGGPPAIVACLATDGFGEGEGDAFTAKPKDDCTDQVFGAFDAEKQAYTFDVSVYAQDWIDGKDNHGLAIRPTEEAVEPFQLTFLGKSKVVTTVDFTRPFVQPTVPVPTVDPVVPVAPPAVDTGTSTFVPEVQPQPRPQASAPPPVVRTTKAPSVAVQNVAANPLRSTRGFSGTFWLAVVAGVFVLGTTSLVLGDPLAPEGSSRNRVRVGGRHRASVPVPARVPARAPRPRTV